MPTNVIQLYTDASTSGWGALCNDTSIWGYFPDHLQSGHISVKELHASHAGLMAFVSSIRDA